MPPLTQVAIFRSRQLEPLVEPTNRQELGTWDDEVVGGEESTLRGMAAKVRVQKVDDRLARGRVDIVREAVDGVSANHEWPCAGRHRSVDGAHPVLTRSAVVVRKHEVSPPRAPRPGVACSRGSP